APIDLGPEFIQGRLPALMDLAHEAGEPVIELGGRRWQVSDGRLAPAGADFPAQVSELLSGALARQADEDESIDSFLDKLDLGGSRAVSTSVIRAWVESYDAADLALLSAQALLRERKAEELIDGSRSFRVVTGYDAVPRALLARITSGSVELQTEVTDVEWTAGRVTVNTRPGGVFSARRLVVALPLGVLQSGSVRFTPALPDKDAALTGLVMGPVVKIVFAFKDRFWVEHLPDGVELGFLIAPEEPVRAWWTGYPLIAPLLVAWSGGPPADALAKLSLEQRADRALESLARVLGVGRSVVDDQVRAWTSHDWSADPLARGAYSYVRVGGMRAQAELARAVDGTLFFAGEATELAGHQATVHGALFAGQRAADEVLASLGVSTPTTP
ncbi:MAG TPA: NAD(P)/FAD-dependent oxidoreductase, partial [Chloroflexota bacterium]